MLRDRLVAQPLLIGIEDRLDGAVLGFSSLLDAASPDHVRVETSAEDPAIIVYTSGTTGNPKGVLYAHRILLGHLPGVEFPHDFFPQPGDRMWTPADWAWAGGLDGCAAALSVPWHPGVGKAPEEIRSRGSIRADRPTRYSQRLHAADRAEDDASGRDSRRRASAIPCASIASGGERLGEEMLDWGRDVFGLTMNEFYGQTEANLTVGNCASIMPLKEGSMGRAIPGHSSRSSTKKAAQSARRNRHHCREGAGPGVLSSILEQARCDGRKIPQRLAPDRRHRASGRGRIFLVPRPQRRRYHFRRLPNRPHRDRGLPDAASRGCHGGGYRCARQCPRRSRESLHRPSRGNGGRCRVAGGRAEFRQGAIVRPRISAPDRVSRRVADDHHRKDPAQGSPRRNHRKTS